MSRFCILWVLKILLQKNLFKIKVLEKTLYDHIWAWAFLCSWYSPKSTLGPSFIEFEQKIWTDLIRSLKWDSSLEQLSQCILNSRCLAHRRLVNLNVSKPNPVEFFVSKTVLNSPPMCLLLILAQNWPKKALKTGFLESSCLNMDPIWPGQWRS